jgi:hypothetical protein
MCLSRIQDIPETVGNGDAERGEYIDCSGGHRAPFGLNTPHEKIAIGGRGSAIMSGKAFTPVISLPPDQPSNRSTKGRNEEVWLRRVSRGYLIGRRSGQGCCTLEGQGMGYGNRPHDWKLSELESMETLSPSPLSLSGCSALGSFL